MMAYDLRKGVTDRQPRIAELDELKRRGITLTVVSSCPSSGSIGQIHHFKRGGNWADVVLVTQDGTFIGPYALHELRVEV